MKTILLCILATCFLQYGSPLIYETDSGLVSYIQLSPVDVNNVNNPIPEEILEDYTDGDNDNNTYEPIPRKLPQYENLLSINGDILFVYPQASDRDFTLYIIDNDNGNLTKHHIQSEDNILEIKLPTNSSGQYTIYVKLDYLLLLGYVS